MTKHFITLIQWDILNNDRIRKNFIKKCYIK